MILFTEPWWVKGPTFENSKSDETENFFRIVDFIIQAYSEFWATWDIFTGANTQVLWKKAFVSFVLGEVWYGKKLLEFGMLEYR